MLPSKARDSIFYFSIIQDFQQQLIFINKAYQAAENQRNYKDNLLLPAQETLEKTQMSTWEVLNTSDLTAKTHKVKVVTSLSKALLRLRKQKKILKSYENKQLHKWNVVICCISKF